VPHTISAANAEPGGKKLEKATNREAAEKREDFGFMVVELGLLLNNWMRLPET
jgi:hypothetical protein